MIAAGLRSFGIPILDGNIFRKVTISCTNNFVMSLVDFCMEWSGIHIPHAP